MSQNLTSLHGRHVGLTASRALRHAGLTASPESVVNATAATLALKPDEHAGKLITLNRAGGIAVTLPAATGSGDVYRLVTGTTFTTSATIKVANGTDIMVGFATFFNNAADTVSGYETAADSDTITFDAAVSGLKGDRVTLQDVKLDGTTAVWLVDVVASEDGTAATPFSATVA